MKLQKRINYVLAIPAFIVATVIAQFAFVLPTNAAALQWTGEGDGTHFSDAENWSTGAAPVSGDSITFPGVVGTQSVTLQNDLTNVRFSGIALSAVASTAYGSTNYTIDKLALSNNAQITSSNGSGITTNAYFGGVGELDVNGNVSIGTNIGSSKLTVTGNITLANGGGLYATTGSTVSGKVIVNSTGFYNSSTNLNPQSFELTGSNPQITFSSAFSTISTPIVVSGTGARVSFSSVSTYNQETDTSTYTDKSYTISSPVTLSADLNVRVERAVTASFTGTVTANGFAIKKSIDSTGTLKIGNEAVVPVTKTTEYKDSQPNAYVQVAENETAVLDGSRGGVSVYSGGILKGTGSARYLFVSNGGILAPGHSPGTLTIREDLYVEGQYQAELLNKDSYDKLVVGEDYTGTGNAVYLTSEASLNVALVSGWSVAQGDQFTIVDNKSTTAVEGVFSGLPEGTQFTIEGIVFNITYVGGDGNDVVLTALNAGTYASTPNTGAKGITLSSPVVIASLGIVSVTLIGLLVLGRRSLKK